MMCTSGFEMLMLAFAWQTVSSPYAVMHQVNFLAGLMDLDRCYCFLAIGDLGLPFSSTCSMLQTLVYSFVDCHH